MKFLHLPDILCYVTPASSSRFFTSLLSEFEFAGKHPSRTLKALLHSSYSGRFVNVPEFLVIADHGEVFDAKVQSIPLGVSVISHLRIRLFHNNKTRRSGLFGG
jgi:hypothetical protein